MKKKYIKLISLCIVCALFIIAKGCKNTDSFKDIGEIDKQILKPVTRSGELAWDYPVKPGMEEWKLFQSNEEKVRACQIPEEIISSLTTEELTDLCLKYPLIYDIFAFNNINAGLDKLFSDFNGIRELNKRDDASNLINRYNDKVQSFSFLDGTAPEIEKGGFVVSVSILEVLLSRVEMHKDSQKEILKSLVAGYEAKFRYVDYFKGLGFKTNLYSRGHVILKIDKSSIDSENSILFSGMGDEQSVNIIDRLSYQLIN